MDIVIHGKPLFWEKGFKTPSSFATRGYTDVNFLHNHDGLCQITDWLRILEHSARNFPAS